MPCTTATWWANKEMVKYLESVKANLNAKNYKGQSLLHIAIENNRYKMLVYLSFKLSIEEQNCHKQTPLIYSVIME